jgi:hypothetical protein
VASLEGVDAKIARAKRHLAELKSELEDVLNPNAQRFEFEAESGTGKHVYRVYGVPAIDHQWSTAVGDCLFNLRSALDHLAWQLVLLDGAGEPGKRTQFPIRESPFNKNGDRVPTQLRPSVSRQDILDGLEAVQPYNAEGSQLSLIIETARCGCSES